MHMKLSQQLAHRFREVIFDGTWIAGTNYLDQLQNLTWHQATTKVEDYNTIALLTFHIDYYIEGVLQVFLGGTLTIRDRYSFDAPQLTSGQDWQDLKKRFFLNAKALAEEFRKLPDEQLSEPFVKEGYGTYLRNIEGMIEHCYYHLGQITLLRKTILKTAG